MPALKHLWQVSGYKAEADEIDEKALQSLVADLKKSADYAFDPEPTDTTKAAQERRQEADLPHEVRARHR